MSIRRYWKCFKRLRTKLRPLQIIRADQIDGPQTEGTYFTVLCSIAIMAICREFRVHSKVPILKKTNDISVQCDWRLYSIRNVTNVSRRKHTYGTLVAGVLTFVCIIKAVDLKPCRVYSTKSLWDHSMTFSNYSDNRRSTWFLNIFTLWRWKLNKSSHWINQKFYKMMLSFVNLIEWWKANLASFQVCVPGLWMWSAIEFIPFSFNIKCRSSLIWYVNTTMCKY